VQRKNGPAPAEVDANKHLMRGAIEMINGVILVAVVLCIAMIGQAVAEIVDGNKLFADCRDGDDPSARDSATDMARTYQYVRL